jgi:hypothetical protein
MHARKRSLPLCVYSVGLRLREIPDLIVKTNDAELSSGKPSPFSRIFSCDEKEHRRDFHLEQISLRKGAREEHVLHCDGSLKCSAASYSTVNCSSVCNSYDVIEISKAELKYQTGGFRLQIFLTNIS